MLLLFIIPINEKVLMKINDRRLAYIMVGVVPSAPMLAMSL